MRAVPLTLVAILSCVLGVILTWPLLLRLSVGLSHDLGDPLLNTYILAWDADRLRHGLSGLWDATLLFPYRNTLAWSEHLIGTALLTAPLQWLTGNPVLVHNVAVLGSYVLAGVGMFGLVRHLTGRTDAAVVAAVAFVCAPHRAVHGARLQMLMSGWMPLALWGLHAYFSTGRRWALVGFVVAFALLGLSNGYYVYFFAATVLVVTAGELLPLLRPGIGDVGSPRPRVGRAVIDVSTAALALLAVMLPVALVYLDVQQTMGFSRSRDEILMFSATLDDYRRALPHMTTWPGVLSGGRPERTLFPGGVVLLLALAGLVGIVRRDGAGVSSWDGRRLRLMYLALALVAVWLSMGRHHASFDWLLTHVPGLAGLRVPARMAVVVSLALCVLAGFGAASLLSRVSAPVVRTGLCALLAMGLLRDGYGGPVTIHAVDRPSHERAALTQWMAMQEPGAVLEWPLYASRDEWTRNLPAQMASLDHRRRVVNGYSGYGSALQDFIGGPGSPVLTKGEWPAVFDGLARIGVRIIVVRKDAPLLPDLQPDPLQVTGRWEGETLTAFALREPGTPVSAANTRGTRLRATEDYTVTTSHRPDRVKDMLDGNPMTRWISGDAQRGDEWVHVTLARPQSLEAVLMDVPVETANYPRHLIIEVVTEEGSVETVFNGSVVPQLLEAMVTAPRRPIMQLALPRHPVREVRLRQTASIRTWNWHIQELQIVARSMTDE